MAILRGSRPDRLLTGALVLVEEGVQALSVPVIEHAGSPLTGDSLETGDFAQLRTRARVWKATVS